MIHDNENQESRRPVYIYLLLLSGYILYLTLGAFIFTWIEEPAEIQKCESARKELKEKIFKAGDDYFYDMGLNLKVFLNLQMIHGLKLRPLIERFIIYFQFCRGATEWLRNSSNHQTFSLTIVDFFRSWQGGKCSQEFIHLYPMGQRFRVRRTRMWTC